MTPAEIAALRALCDAATPGPWWVDTDTEGETRDVVAHGPYDDTQSGIAELYTEADAAFIAAARTALPAALSALEEARANAVDHRVRLEEERTLKNVYEARAAESYQRGRDAAMADYEQACAAAESALEEARRETARLQAAFTLNRSEAERLQGEAAKFEAQATAAESRADALQKERDEAEGGMRVYERAAKIATAERDALQAEVESLRAGISYAVKRREKETARADAAWRAVEAARALSVGWEAKGDAPRRYSYPEADAADGAERDTYRRCADDLKAALPPPSATPNEET